MKKREYNSFSFIFLVFLFVLIFFFIFIAFPFSMDYTGYMGYRSYKKPIPPFNPGIESQGFERIPKILEKNDVENILEMIRDKKYKKVYDFLNSPSILSKVRNILPRETAIQYIFQDYSYFILKSRVHTCHRDNNGTLFNPTQKYPSYTILFYLEDIGQGLDVIPGSHHMKNTVFISESTIPIHVQRGDAILFDANLIHAGIIHPKDSIRIQMKVSHRNDISVLSFYEDFHKVLDKSNTSFSMFTYLQKWISCHFPIFSDYFMSNEDA